MTEDICLTAPACEYIKSASAEVSAGLLVVLLSLSRKVSIGMVHLLEVMRALHALDCVQAQANFCAMVLSNNTQNIPCNSK